MKRMTSVLSPLALLLALVGCGRPSMNAMIDNKPSMSGVVQEVHDTHILIYIEADGYIAESDPLQINTVYTITLMEPADRTSNHKG